MQDAVDVLVVGAGPVGLALANGLAHWGIAARVVDKKPGPETHSKAANLWPRTQEAAAAMGFAAPLIAGALPVSVQTMYAYGSLIANIPTPPRPTTVYPQTLAAHQGMIEQTLSERLRATPHPVEYDTEVLDVRQSGEGVEATLARQGAREMVRCRYLVACDGGRSVVRERIGIRLTPLSLPGIAFRQIDAHLHWNRPLHNGQLWFFLSRAGFMGVVELPDGTYRIFTGEDEAHIPDRLPTLPEMEAALRQAADDPTVRLSDPVWYSHGHFRYGVAERFRAGRVFLAGDAAHMTIPIGGQGMNTGIQDAFNLGWKLAAVLHGRSPASLLDSYDAERRRVREELAADQVANFHRLVRPSPVQRLATRTLGTLVMRRGQSVELGRRDESQLSIRYPDSPLTEEHLGKRGVRAGDRAPNAASVVERPGGRTVRLFDLFSGTHWTLLAFDGAKGGATRRVRTIAQEVEARFPAVRAYPVLAHRTGTNTGEIPGRALLDRDHAAHDSFRMAQPSLVLVRPDGHIGFRGALRDAGALVAYCCRVFAPAVATGADGTRLGAAQASTAAD